MPASNHRLQLAGIAPSVSRRVAHLILPARREVALGDRLFRDTRLSLGDNRALLERISTA
jgi:hypothetical protein